MDLQTPEPPAADSHGFEVLASSHHVGHIGLLPLQGQYSADMMGVAESKSANAHSANRRMSWLLGVFLPMRSILKGKTKSSIGVCKVRHSGLVLGGFSKRFWDLEPSAPTSLREP